MLSVVVPMPVETVGCRCGWYVRYRQRTIPVREVKQGVVRLIITIVGTLAEPSDRFVPDDC